MSKRNLFLGTAAGKVGDVVVYRAGGTQRARVRVVPKDPKTTTQMSQRSRVGGLVSTYRAGKGLLQDTFESKPSKQSAYNAYAQDTMPTAPYLTKQMNDLGCAIPMPMTIARGSVPAPWSSVSRANDGLSAIVEVPADAEATTIASLSALLIAARPCCFKNGSQIIAVSIQYEQVNGEEETFRKPFFNIGKITLDTSDASQLPASGVMSITVADGMATLKVNGDDTEESVYGILVANKDADGLHVTNAEGYMSSAAETLYQSFLTEAAKAAAAESYGASAGSCVL